MNLWRFIPAVKKPWNPAWHDVWDAMTHRERQVSFLIDAAIVALAIVALVAGHAFGKAIFP